jgi:hypothetical protein
MAVTKTHRKIPEWFLLLLAMAVVWLICAPFWQWQAPAGYGSNAERKLTGNMWTGTRLRDMLLGPEQIASYMCFLWACMIGIGRGLEVRRQRHSFDLKLLPTEVGTRILPEDARPLLRRAEHLAGDRPYFLSNLIRLALNKFAISRSAQDASEAIRTQAEVDLGRLTSSMSTLNYLAWAIPAIGFLGTVRGIGMALTVAPDIQDSELAGFLDETTRNLAVAFDTTFVALVLSLILMFILHAIQRDEEALIYDAQQYCLEHLIGRLYDLPHSSATTTGREPPAFTGSGPSPYEFDKSW